MQGWCAWKHLHWTFWICGKFNFFKKQPNKHNFEISQVGAVLQPAFFWAYRYMCRGWDFNGSIGECTIRQTDQQKFWLYLAAFWSQTTKQSLLNWFKNWVNFLGAHTNSTVWRYVWVQHCDSIFTWSHQFMFVTGCTLFYKKQ